MGEPALKSNTFPTAHCETCGRNVLTYLSLAGETEARRACVHCDSPVDGDLRWVSAAELAADGYQIGRAPSRQHGGCGGGCACSMRGR